MTLIDDKGLPFGRARLAGRWTLVTFGSTSDAATAPVSLAHAAQMLERWPDGEPPQVVMVTLDPLTDTRERLAAYLRAFDSRIVGVTGSAGAIEHTAALFRVGHRRTAAGHIEHSARWYLVSPQVRVASLFEWQASAAELADGVREVRQTWLGVA